MNTKNWQQKTSAAPDRAEGSPGAPRNPAAATPTFTSARSFAPEHAATRAPKRALLIAGCLSALVLGATPALACPPTVTPATGGAAISADTVGGAWTTLTGPSIAEGIASEIGTGTLVLKAPSGFVFNTAAPVTVLLKGVSQARQNLNNLTSGSLIPAVVTSSSITITISDESSDFGGTNSLTWQNIQVRPVASAPLASGNITLAGTACIFDLNGTANWGTLQEVSGSLAGYKVLGSGTATVFTPSTVTIQKIDRFGNPLCDSSARTVTLTGLGTVGVQPLVNSPVGCFGLALSVTFNTNGAAPVTFTDCKVESGIVNVTDGSVSSAAVNGGLPVTVNPGLANTLVFTSVPNGLAYGSTFSVSVRSTDSYGNASTVGLGGSQNVSLGLASGSGTIAGTTSVNIGTNGGNGAATFSGLKITAAGNSVLQATASGFTLASNLVSVAPATVTPAVTVGNKTYDGTASATILTRTLNGILNSDNVSLGTSGTASFSDRNAGTGKTVSVSGLTLTGPAAGNYVLSTSSTSAVASVAPRPLTITAAPVSKVYDGTTLSTMLPAITIGGLVAGDIGAFSQSFADKNAGLSKTLIPSGSVNDGNGGANYSLSFVGANLGTITTRLLMVSADDQTSQYGAKIPTLTASYAGFATGETLGNSGISGSPTLATTATSSSLPGVYPITIAQGSLSAANYSFSLVSGIATIVPATGTSPGDITDGLTVWMIQTNGNHYLAMKFKRNVNAAALGLQYLPQVSGDKQNWLSDAANIVELNVLPIDSNLEWVTVQDQTPISESNPRFVQLKVLAN